MKYSFFTQKIMLTLLVLPLWCPQTLKSEAYVFSSALSFVSAGGLILGAFALKNDYKNLWATLEEQLIKDWIAKNNFNQYGEPQETAYPNGTPLKANQSSIDYIKNKYPKKPWFKGYKKMLKPVSGMPLAIPTMMVSGIVLLFTGKYLAQLAMNNK